jgi:SNF2 family DNA or RNA helicase
MQDLREALMKYRYKRKPYAHQKDALLKLVKTGFGGALLMQPRTGKTKVLIDYACVLHKAGHVNRVLVSCPVAVMGVWEDELAANVPDDIKYTLTVWDKDARKETALPKWGKDRMDWVIINHDAFSTAGKITGKDKHGNIKRSRKKGGRYDMKRAFNLWQPQLVAVDESHRFKTPSSAKLRTLLAIIWNRDGTPKVPYRVIMTGTAITKKKRIFDIYAQWKIINPRRFAGMTFRDFKHHYGRWVNMGSYERWVGNREHEVEKLRGKIHLDSFAVTREECFDLPKASHQVYPVQMSSDTAQAYDDMAEQMVAKIKTGEIAAASIPLVVNLRLAQITSGIVKTEPTPDHPNGRLVRIGTEKMDAIESILSDLFEADEKVVIAARFSADIAAIAQVCTKLKVDNWTIQGRRKGPDQDRKTKDANIKKFRAHDGPAAMIIHPQAAGMGIDLSTASTMVWYSLTNSWVDYTQACDRIALNPHSVSYIYLLASPNDQIMYEGLQEDGDFVKTVQASPDKLLRNYKN